MKTWPQGFHTARMQHISRLSEKVMSTEMLSLTGCQYTRTASSSIVSKLNLQFISPTLGDSISN